MQEESETNWHQQQVGTASTCCSSSRNSKKDLINEAAISVGGDNENDADDDDEANDDDDDEEDDFAPSSNDKETEEKTDEAAASVSSDVRPKKKAKVDNGMKTKNSKPTQSNPRGGIAESIADLASNIGSNQSLGLMMNMMQQQSPHPHSAACRNEVNIPDFSIIKSRSIGASFLLAFFDIGPTNLSNSNPLRGNPWSTQKQ